MKRMMVATFLMATLATPAIAGHLVYLKDGGVIRAKSAWCSKGKVHVLVNRDTLTEFSPAEINMKKTFAQKTRKVRKVRKAQQGAVLPRRPAAAVPLQPVATQGPEKKRTGFSLPSLPERSPESLKGSGEGAIRKQKREMKERLEE